MSEMDEESQDWHNELVGRDRIEHLPISKLLTERIVASADANGDFDKSVAIAAIVTAIASLEELIRGGM